jgi:hypothetical protein
MYWIHDFERMEESICYKIVPNIIKVTEEEHIKERPILNTDFGFKRV